MFPKQNVNPIILMMASIELKECSIEWRIYQVLFFTFKWQLTLSLFSTTRKRFYTKEKWKQTKIWLGFSEYERFIARNWYFQIDYVSVFDLHSFWGDIASFMNQITSAIIGNWLTEPMGSGFTVVHVQSKSWIIWECVDNGSGFKLDLGLTWNWSSLRAMFLCSIYWI